MTTTVIHSRHHGNDLDTQLATELAIETKLTGPAWYLNRHRIGSLNRTRDPFNVAAWLEAVNASDLHEKVKETARHIAASVNWDGRTDSNRYDLAGLAAVTRVMTISTRVDRLEAAGFINTKHRFNQSNVMQLTVPLGTVLPPHTGAHPEQTAGF